MMLKIYRPTRVFLGALPLCFAAGLCFFTSSCGDEVGPATHRSGRAGSVGTPNQGGQSSGSGGTPSSSGGSNAAAGSSGDNGATGGTNASGGAGNAGTGAVGGAAGGPSKCSAPCSGNTPVCDDASAQCKTCSATAGCGTDKPVCETGANGGLGACKAIEVLAFYTVYEQMADLAHRSYSREANDWFPSNAQANGLSYESTTDWNRLESVTAEKGRVIMFFDNAPGDPSQRSAFKSYIEKGGAWIGFHVSAYNDSSSTWDWYFKDFLGCGMYKGNTWRPTSANLKVEDTAHPVTQGLGSMFKAAPNEWYSWQVDLRTKSNIKILCSIDPSSFPLGTGPKEFEIWHSGYYPVVWTNTNHKMVYINMGHNDMDYGANKALSSTFSSSTQNQLLLNAIRWLAGASKGL